jgi:hypothetical protein
MDNTSKGSFGSRDQWKDASKAAYGKMEEHAHNAAYALNNWNAKDFASHAAKYIQGNPHMQNKLDLLGKWVLRSAADETHISFVAAFLIRQLGDAFNCFYNPFRKTTFQKHFSRDFGIFQNVVQDGDCFCVFAVYGIHHALQMAEIRLAGFIGLMAVLAPRQLNCVFKSCVFHV